MQGTPMMVSRDVGMDLLPLYLAGEASEDSRALVEQCAARDPIFARAVEQAQRGEDAIRDDLVGAPAPEPDLAKLGRWSSMNRLCSILLPAAIFFTCVPFTGASTSRGTWFMMRDLPAIAIASAVIAAASWVAWLRVRRVVRTCGE